MSRVIWKKCLLPNQDAVETYAPDIYSAEFGVARVARLPLAETDIELPDRRVYRSMSRAAVFLSRLCLDALPALKDDLDADPYSVGMYCVVENGPSDYLSAAKIREYMAQNQLFHESYKRLRSPKLYLKQLPNLAAAQAGIFLGCMGPMNIYNHSVFGGLQAIEQADLDLAQGVVSKALVCSAFSLEDPLLTKRTSLLVANGKVLCEGAAVLVLERSSERFRFTHKGILDHMHFGISQSIIEEAFA